MILSRIFAKVLIIGKLKNQKTPTFAQDTKTDV
jgi:hypothetical protein